MIDINYSLRVAYFSALSGITGVAPYYQFLPASISPQPQNYIVFRSITNNDSSTKNSSDINCSITVEIHTWTEGDNNGLSADVIARDVFNRILPNPGATLTLDGAQMVSTRLLNDITQDFTNEANRGYISRFLTFGHKIFLRSDIS